TPLVTKGVPLGVFMYQAVKPGVEKLTERQREVLQLLRPRVVCVLERIAADLDNLSMVPNDAHADKESNHDDPRERHRHELAEPPPKPKKLSHREQRAALRAALGLPHSKKIRSVQKTERLSAVFAPLLLGTHFCRAVLLTWQLCTRGVQTYFAKSFIT